MILSSFYRDIKYFFRTKVRTIYNSEDGVWNKAEISAASINNVLMRLVSAEIPVRSILKLVSSRWRPIFKHKGIFVNIL